MKKFFHGPYFVFLALLMISACARAEIEKHPFDKLISDICGNNNQCKVCFAQNKADIVKKQATQDRACQKQQQAQKAQLLGHSAKPQMAPMVGGRCGLPPVYLSYIPQCKPQS